LIFGFNLREKRKFTSTHSEISYGHAIHRRLPPILAEIKAQFLYHKFPFQKMNARVDGFFAEYRKLKAKYVPVCNRPYVSTLTYFE
jgi:hypothetical protein